jgi:hypothetical protein
VSKQNKYANKLAEARKHSARRMWARLEAKAKKEREEKARLEAAS